MGILGKLFNQVEKPVDQELNEIEDKLRRLQLLTDEVLAALEQDSIGVAEADAMLVQLDDEKEACLTRLKKLQRRT